MNLHLNSKLHKEVTPTPTPHPLRTTFKFQQVSVELKIAQYAPHPPSPHSSGPATATPDKKKRRKKDEENREEKKKQQNKVIDISQQLCLSLVRAQMSSSKLDRKQVQKKNKRKRKQTKPLLSFFLFYMDRYCLEKKCWKCAFRGQSFHGPFCVSLRTVVNKWTCIISCLSFIYKL